jgi:hypothetical protein
MGAVFPMMISSPETRTPAFNHSRQRLLGLPRHRLQETYVSIIALQGAGVGEGVGVGVGVGEVAGVGEGLGAGGWSSNHLVDGSEAAKTALFLLTQDSGNQGVPVGRGTSLRIRKEEEDEDDGTQCQHDLYHEGYHDDEKFFFVEDYGGRFMIRKRVEGSYNWNFVARPNLAVTFTSTFRHETR